MKKTILSLAFVAMGVAAFAQTEAGSIMIGGSVGFGTSGGTNEVSGAPAGNGSVDLPKANNFSIAPSAAYFIKDNLAVGASLNFGTNSTTTTRYYNNTTGTVVTPGIGFTPGPNQVKYDDKTTTSGFGISLFANKFNDLNDKWKWYYGAALGFNNGGGKMTNIVETSPGVWTSSEVDAPKTTNLSLGANLGVVYFLTPNWAFFGGLNNLVALNYQMTKAETSLPAGGTATAKTNSMNVTLATGSVTSGAVSFGVYYFLGK